jgi:hypothetical protein
MDRAFLEPDNQLLHACKFVKMYALALYHTLRGSWSYHNVRSQVLHPYKTARKLTFVYCNFYIFGQQMERQVVMDWVVASIT